MHEDRSLWCVDIGPRFHSHSHDLFMNPGSLGAETFPVLSPVYLSLKQNLTHGKCSLIAY